VATTEGQVLLEHQVGLQPVVVSPKKQIGWSPGVVTSLDKLSSLTFHASAHSLQPIA
jgi:hypothetical protein